jgi:hypothetical protein
MIKLRSDIRVELDAESTDTTKVFALEIPLFFQYVFRGMIRQDGAASVLHDNFWVPKGAGDVYENNALTPHLHKHYHDLYELQKSMCGGGYAEEVIQSTTSVSQYIALKARFELAEVLEAAVFFGGIASEYNAVFHELIVGVLSLGWPDGYSQHCVGGVIDYAAWTRHLERDGRRL